MWPWEHLAFGYLLYSGTVRAVYRRLPSGIGAFALAFGTQFPDLVDKPGNWVFGVLPSGTSVAHSIFVAVPLTVCTAELTRRRGGSETGVAFGIGYLSHLFGDVFYYVLLGGQPAVGAILWPFGPTYAEKSAGVVERVSGFLARYVEHLFSPRGIGYLALELSVLALTVALWVRDGKPGVGLIRRARTVARERRSHDRE